MESDARSRDVAEASREQQVHTSEPERVVAVVQARLSSTRLPAKVLLDLQGATALERCVRRVRRIEGVQQTVVATTTNGEDDLIEAVCERMGIETGVDLFKLMDVAEEVIVPMMEHMVRIDRDSLTLGFAGVYSTFLLHAKRASARFGVPARDILLELGRRKMIAGQEDMIEDTAMTLAKQRGLWRDVQRDLEPTA